MKDIIVKANQIRTELIIYTICFLAAMGLNIYAIATFKTDWSEIISQLPSVLGIAFVFYLVVILIRLLILGIIRIKKQTR